MRGNIVIIISNPLHSQGHDKDIPDLEQDLTCCSHRIQWTEYEWYGGLLKILVNFQPYTIV